MSSSCPDTDELLRRATAGDVSAETALLARHRARLRRMVSMRLDERIAARVDPSDVVQDVLAKAAHDLGKYLSSRPLPFYPRLRQMAWERLIQVHRQHIAVQARSVLRERPMLSDASAQRLVEHLADRASSPSHPAALPDWEPLPGPIGNSRGWQSAVDVEVRSARMRVHALDESIALLADDLLDLLARAVG